MLEKAAASYGGILGAGVLDRARATTAATKLTGFGNVIRAMQSQDAQVRKSAKSALINMLMTKQQLDQSLIMHHEQLKAQLG